MRHIFSQGDYDGACFLYALANAYKAVTSKTPSCRVWDNAIRSLKYSNDFLGGCIGTTEHFSTDPKSLKEAVATICESFNSEPPTIQWEAFPELTKSIEVARLIDPKSVVVFRYQGLTAHVGDIDHWVCGVAYTEKPIFKLQLACSYRRVQDDCMNGKRYRENYHRYFERYYNNWLHDKHGVQIFPGSVFKVWKEI